MGRAGGKARREHCQRGDGYKLLRQALIPALNQLVESLFLHPWQVCPNLNFWELLPCSQCEIHAHPKTMLL